MPLTENRKKLLQSPEYKAKVKARMQKPENIAKAKARRQTPEYKATAKEYREKNKAKDKIYQQSPAGIKTRRISDWRCRGVICDDFDELYERYLNTKFCEECNVELTIDKTRTNQSRCLDHDHNTGEFRNVVCCSCNNKRR